MLYLLIALQLSSTNCIADAAGVIHCTTLSTPQVEAPPIPERSRGDCALCNVISIFQGDAKKRHSKAVGKMLAAGDCVGAEKYALEKGDLDLADRAKAYCAPGRAKTLGPSDEASTQETPGSESDWDFVKKPE